ncbi:MAG: Fe2+ or Zn2+ uptake regulation protein [Candidatus Nanohaloarchaea archaeon]|jgi:Fe2+ or Zn2+ uptake regulation protein
MAGSIPALNLLGVITMTEQPQQMDAQQIMQVMQQKLGNVEITVHALLSVLQEEGIVDQEEINEKAQEIVEEMQEQQAEGGVPEDLQDELEDE